MSIITVMSRIIRDLRARHRRRVVSAHLASLPLEVRKDIGWSDALDRPRARRKHGN